jgi:hypothetical protein
LKYYQKAAYLWNTDGLKFVEKPTKMRNPNAKNLFEEFPNNPTNLYQESECYREQSIHKNTFECLNIQLFSVLDRKRLKK